MGLGSREGGGLGAHDFIGDSLSGKGHRSVFWEETVVSYGLVFLTGQFCPAHPPLRRSEPAEMVPGREGYSHTRTMVFTPDHPLENPLQKLLLIRRGRTGCPRVFSAPYATRDCSSLTCEDSRRAGGGASTSHCLYLKVP